MKALTVHQPWATLTALGVRTVETRSWSTTYRGRLYIHAGKHVEWLMRIGDYAVLRDRDVPDRFPSALAKWEDDTTAVAVCPLPLGAIVATCELVDVVPIVKASNEMSKPGKFIHVYPGLRPGSSALWLCELRVHGGIETLDLVEDQRPYGDFRPGRYAWLLDNIQPVDPPVPCRGRQGLWTPPEGLLPA